MTGFCFQLSSTGVVSDVLDSKAATVDCTCSFAVDKVMIKESYYYYCFSSRLVD